MKLNSRGIVAETLLLYVLGAVVLFFVPNPVSQAVGVGVKPNKTVQTQSKEQKVDFLKKDLMGRPVAESDGSYLIGTTTTNKTSDEDIQQHQTLFDQFKALPGLFMLLVILGLFGIGPGAVIVKKLWDKFVEWRDRHHELELETARAVKSVDAGLDYWDAQIAAAVAGSESATKTAATISDPVLLAAQRSIIEQYDAVATALERTKKGFLDAMKKKQDESTGEMVKAVRKIAS